MEYSILIPAYKSIFLKEAIDSVLAQTYGCFELIILDDCSPEDIKSIVSDYSDCRIRYERNDNNIGSIDLVDNWNKCLSYANGDYVICMGDDDKLAPTCLENYNSLIEKYPGLNVYHTRTLLIDEKSEIWQIQEERPEYESGYSLWWHRWNGRCRQYVGDFLYSRTHLLSLGGFYKLPLAWASDDITAVRAAIETGIANSAIPGFFYRESRMSISNSSSAKIKAEAICLEEKWYQDQLSGAITDNELDAILIDLLKKDFYGYFKKKFWQLFLIDIYKSPFGLLFWYKNHSKFLMSRMEIICGFSLSLVRRLLKR